MPLRTRPPGTASIVDNLIKHKCSRSILLHLKEGTNDPADIARIEMCIPPSTMCERLRTMQRYNLILRLNKSNRPKIVVYRLTPKGSRILTVLELIEELDALPDQDPRALQELFRTDFRIQAPRTFLLSETAPPNLSETRKSRKTKTEDVALI